MSVIGVKSPTLSSSSSSNGLTMHQSRMDDWRRSPTKNKGKYPPCECCPYGYHIDLDFVRFCEAMAQGSTGDTASKQRRRERRRQRQSMEVMLGLASPPTWVADNNISEILQEPSETVVVKNTEGSACASEPVRDALQKAVMDFEETLQRSSSGRRTTTNNWLPDVVADEKEENQTTNSMKEPANFQWLLDFKNGRLWKRRSANSGMWPSEGEVEPPRLPLEEDESPVSDVSPFLGPHPGPPPDFQDSDVASNTSVLSAGALQNIREQMAMSLERMKDLEEQVKMIPVLQVQLSVLTEDKKQLEEKLKMQQELRKKSKTTDNINDYFQAGKYHTLPALDRKKPLSNQDNFVFKGWPEELRSGRKPVYTTRDASVSCSVMTRDVGVSHSTPKQRTVGTITSSMPVPLERLTIHEVSKENIAPTINEFKDNVLSLKSIIGMPEYTNTSVITDLRMDQVYSDVDLDRNIDKAIKMYEKSYLQKLLTKKKETPVTHSVGIQASPQDNTLHIVEKRDTGVQTYTNLHSVSVSVTAKPVMVNTEVTAKPETQDSASSDSTINDILCDKCGKEILHEDTENLFEQKLIQDKKESLSLNSLSMTRSKSFDYTDRGPFLYKRTNIMRSVGCTTTKRLTHTTGTDTLDLSAKNKDVAVNTMKRKLVDAAVGDSVRIKNPSVSVCDKCSAAIKNVAKDILSQSSRSEHSGVTTCSRIPRPTTLPQLTSAPAPTPVATSPDKKKYVRQDTYTKITPSTETQEVGTNKPSEDAQLSPSETQNQLKTKSTPNLCEKTRSCSLSEDGSEDGAVDDCGLQTDTLELPDATLFQPIQAEPRKKAEPSKEMRAAMKVLNDALQKSPTGNLQQHLKNANNIVQQEWFKISSTANANPLDVEDYLDCFEEISSKLLEYIVNMTDVSGNTAMHYALSHGNFDVVSILLDSKVCNINQPNAAGYTCVMLVSLAQVRSETHRQVVRRLFQLADVNIRARQHGQTALMLAVSHGRIDMVQMLLDSGADINIQDEDGSTALMCAAEHNHIQIVKLLLAQPDCDLTITDYDGSTALNIAMEAGNRDIGVLLYAQEHFSRGSSPYTSMKHRRAKSVTPTLKNPQPRTPTSPHARNKQDYSF